MAIVAPHGIVPPRGGSALALDTLQLESHERLELGAAGDDVLLFAHGGSGTLAGGSLRPGAAALLLAGESAELAAGSEGLAAVRATVGAATDLHAPMGLRERIVAIEQAGSGQATGSRSYHVLFGPGNGSTRATLFVGFVPPGRAPWHYHLYDEIVWIWRGSARYHTGERTEELGPGSALRITPRQVHVLENTGELELAVLGVFTPAGSPSAAYVASETAAEYGTGTA